MDDDTKTDFHIHKEYVEKYGWVIPTKNVLQAICKVCGTRRLVDYGAGKCFLSYLLRKMGVHVYPVDTYDEIDDVQECFMIPVRIESNEIVTHKNDVLMISWGYDCMETVIEEYIRAGGRCVILLGEPTGGWTLPVDYFTHRRDWCSNVLSMPNFPGFMTQCTVNEKCVNT